MCVRDAFQRDVVIDGQRSRTVAGPDRVDDPVCKDFYFQRTERCLIEAVEAFSF